MLGVCAVIDDQEVVGIITDGDLRRMLAKHEDFTTLTAKEIMTANPKIIDNNAMAVDAFEVLERHNISQLIAVEKGVYQGIVHLHNLIKEGII
jgi:arabinose-5-phosphate isomerase